MATSARKEENENGWYEETASALKVNHEGSADWDKRVVTTRLGGRSPQHADEDERGESEANGKTGKEVVACGPSNGGEADRGGRESARSLHTADAGAGAAANAGACAGAGAGTHTESRNGAGKGLVRSDSLPYLVYRRSTEERMTELSLQPMQAASLSQRVRASATAPAAGAAVGVGEGGELPANPAEEADEVNALAAQPQSESVQPTAGAAAAAFAAKRPWQGEASDHGARTGAERGGWSTEGGSSGRRVRRREEGKEVIKLENDVAER